MLQVFDHDENVWLSAAKWHIECNNSPNVARELIQRGLRLNPQSKLLWHEYFRMELLYCDLIKKRKVILEKEQSQDCKDAILGAKIAMIVFESALKTVEDKNGEFISNFLKIVDEFEDEIHCEELKCFIFETLKKTEPKNEGIWKTIAENSGSEASDIFEMALKEFPNLQMWDYYLTFKLQQLSKMNKFTQIEYIKNEMVELMKRAMDEKHLSKEMFCEWLCILNSFKHDPVLLALHRNLIEKQVDHYESAHVWYTCLSSLIEIDVTLKPEIRRLFERSIKSLEKMQSETQINNLFDKAIKTLVGCDHMREEEKSLLDIWSLYIEWACDCLPAREVMNMLEKYSHVHAHHAASVLENRQYASLVKMLLLQTSNKLFPRDLYKCRYYYEKFKALHPIVDGFFELMIQIELQQKNVNIQRTRRTFDDFWRKTQNSSSSSSFWLKWLQFELTHGDLENISHLYDQALKSLDDELEKNKFMEEYSLMQRRC